MHHPMENLHPSTRMWPIRQTIQINESHSNLVPRIFQKDPGYEVDLIIVLFTVKSIQGPVV
jgi:hypothetical protein